MTTTLSVLVSPSSWLSHAHCSVVTALKEKSMQSVNFIESENGRLTLTGEPWGIISYAFVQQPVF